LILSSIIESKPDCGQLVELNFAPLHSLCACGITTLKVALLALFGKFKREGDFVTSLLASGEGNFVSLFAVAAHSAIADFVMVKVDRG
jgi:hypothetical protein